MYLNVLKTKVSRSSLHSLPVQKYHEKEDDQKRGRPKKSTTAKECIEGPTDNSPPAKTNILEWEAEQTCYGTIRRGPNGEVVLPEGVFENMEMFLGTHCVQVFIRKVSIRNILHCDIAIV